MPLVKHLSLIHISLVADTGQGRRGHAEELLQERLHAEGGEGGAEEMCIRDSAKTLYKTCDIIFMCLPTNAIVKATITDIMNTARPGTIIVDMGSTSPYVIQELHTTALEKGFHLLDSPVSGGETGANGGSLVIMSGGEQEVFEEVKPYMLMMGKSATCLLYTSP